MVHIMNMMQSDMWSLFLHVEEFNMIHDGTLDGIIQQHVHGGWCSFGRFGCTKR